MTSWQFTWKPIHCSSLSPPLFALYWISSLPRRFPSFFVLLRSAVLFSLSLFTHLSHLTQLWPVACLIKLQPQLPTQPGWLLKTSPWSVRLIDDSLDCILSSVGRSRYAIFICIRSARVMRQTFSISIVWNRDRWKQRKLLNSVELAKQGAPILIRIDYLLFVLNKCLWIYEMNTL